MFLVPHSNTCFRELHAEVSVLDSGICPFILERKLVIWPANVFIYVNRYTVKTPTRARHGQTSTQVLVPFFEQNNLTFLSFPRQTLYLLEYFNQTLSEAWKLSPFLIKPSFRNYSQASLFAKVEHEISVSSNIPFWLTAYMGDWVGFWGVKSSSFAYFNKGLNTISLFYAGITQSAIRYNSFT